MHDPGGHEKILMAAGDSIEPFWKVFALHHDTSVYEMLESMRIGNLEIDPGTERANSEQAKNDPWRFEPKRSPLLKVHTQKPFNAETPKALSVESVITPNEIHFIRNHLPVPEINPANYTLQLVNELTGKSFEFSLQDLKTKFKQYTIPVTIQCSGNKRKFMNEYEHLHGLMWDVKSENRKLVYSRESINMLFFC
jgi:sulfite oxidase